MGTYSLRRCRTAIVGLALVLTAFTTTPTRAADAPKKDARTAHAPAATNPAEEQSKPKLLPEVNVKDMPLPELINFLRDVDPTFQAVIAYEPGATRGEPTIQELRLNNVSIDAVMKLLPETYPQIHIGVTGTGDNNGTIYMIRISADPNHPNVPGVGRLAPGDPMFGGPAGFAPGGEGQHPPQAVTFVHRLREIVDDMVPPNAGEADRKTALEQIVSLVQMTLETGGAPSPFKKAEHTPDAVLKLHEGTETLIFHGSPEQAMIVNQALETLQPRQDKDNFNIRQLNTQVRRLSDRVGTLEKFIGLHGPEGGPEVLGEGGPGAAAPQTRPTHPKAADK